MDTATATLPFPALLQGLQTFRDHVGSPDSELRAALLLPGQPALTRSISVEVLGVARTLLVWLRNGVMAVQERLGPIDALLAVAEVAGTLLQALGTSLTSPLPGVGPVASEVTNTLSTLGTALDDLPNLGLLPEPSLVADLRAVLEQLVGVEGEPSTGTLDQLLSEIQALTA